MGHRGWLVERPDGEFREVELPHPTLGTNQVLVRISASGVNPLDTKIRAVKAAHARQPLPAVLGLDMAGTIEEVGSGVIVFRPGDEVYGMVGGVGGLQGTLAELIAVDADLLAHKPKNLSMRQAAALPLSIITAWEALVDRARVHSNQKVLVHAGAGGVGHVAVQIARAFGAEVSPPCRRTRRRSWKASALSPSTTVPTRSKRTWPLTPKGTDSTSSMTPLEAQPWMPPWR